MGRAVVFSDDRVFGVRFEGRVVVSYPRRIWEPTREERGVRLWSSRERTPMEVFELTSNLQTVAHKINDIHGFSVGAPSRAERPGSARDLERRQLA